MYMSVHFCTIFLFMSERWELLGHFDSKYSAKQKMTLKIKCYMQSSSSYYKLCDHYLVTPLQDTVYLEYNSFGLNPASSRCAGDGGPCYSLYLLGFHSPAPRSRTNRPIVSVWLWQDLVFFHSDKDESANTAWSGQLAP